MMRNLTYFFLLIFTLPGMIFVMLSETLTAQTTTETVHEKVLQDWKKQEKCAWRTLGSVDSMRALIENARKLETLAETTKNPTLAELRQAISVAEEALRNVKQKKVKYPKTLKFSEKLYYHSILGPTQEPEKLNPVITCTRGGHYDFEQPYFLENDELFPETICRTGEVVKFKLTGLNPEIPYQVRIVFTSDWQRTHHVFINGEDRGKTYIDMRQATERFYPLQGVAEAEIEIRYTLGPNVTMATIQLLSEQEPTDEAKRAELLERLPEPNPAILRPEWIALRTVMRKVLFSSSELDFNEILFVKRHHPQGNHQCGHRVGENQTAGADLMILRGLSPDGEVRGLLPPELAEKCGIGRMDLSHDARKIVFPLALPRPVPTPYPWGAGHAHYDPKNPTDCTYYHGGATLTYDVFTVNVDGTELKNLTNNPEYEDSEPCFLPDGRIMFTSTRGGRFVQCGDWSPVFGLHVMNADGSGVRAITQPQDTEFYPALMEDGRILFTRWDYVMKPYNVIQELWAMNPDGTRAQKVYGDWYKFSRGPIAMQEARQIPGTRKLVTVGCAHHNSGVGPILTVNMSLNRGGPEGMKLVTPEIYYPEISGMDDEREDTTYADIKTVPAQSGWFTSPYPLSETLFLCVFSPEANNLRDKYGIYLLSETGIKELVYRFDDTSCYCPIPLKPRPKPPVIADLGPFPSGTPGHLILQDVYQGLDGIPRGSVKWLRVCESYPKLRHTNPHRVDAGISCGWDMRGVLGYVPVAEDGSASFEVPSDRMIFLSALDENFQEIQRMRNYVTLRPGEVQGCVGCHENPLDASPVSRFAAGPRLPEKIQPPTYGVGPMQFERVIQPILNARCVSCHEEFRGGKRIVAPTIGDPDEGPQHMVTSSFAELVKYVSYYKMTSYKGKKTFQAPRSFGSGVSPLMNRLRDTPCGENVTEDEWRAFSDWIDCNAPYYGSYDEDFLTSESP
ncbi:MAG: hypothetical protein Q4C70_08640 [Planctomycetia bacterium]|nr:hypothetical protein [Planctomycetia bacterium]